MDPIGPYRALQGDKHIEVILEPQSGDRIHKALKDADLRACVFSKADAGINPA